MALRLLTFSCVLCVAANVFAQGNQIPPAPGTIVTDEAGVLSSGEQQALERKLVAFNDSSSTQIAVAIFPTIGGAEALDYATRLGRAWGVGQAGKDNGVVLLIAMEERDIAIATGYGAEGGLTDATSGTIIRRILTPRFRQGEFYAGLDQATDAIIEALQGEFSAEDVDGDDGAVGWIALAFIVAILLLFFVIAMAAAHDEDGDGDGTRRRYRRRSPNVIFLPSPGGGWDGGRTGGGFGGGGFGGGGFGGFGGGSFGGGGAAGGW